MTKIGLALGGGGATGLGHIPVLEAFDELGLKPARIAGTSMGALIGAGYAGGMSGADIRAYCLHLARRPFEAAKLFWGAGKHQDLGTFAAIDPLRIVHAFLPDSVPRTFEDLEIPLCAVATDFHRQEEAHLQTGDLHSAIAASIAVPGVFSPVERDGRIYVDGGVTNNVPFDLLDGMDVTVAVDVACLPPTESKERPTQLAASTGAMRIMMRAMINAKMKTVKPTMLIEPESRRFGLFDFLKAEAILETAEHARADTLAMLKTVLKA